MLGERSRTFTFHYTNYITENKDVFTTPMDPAAPPGRPRSSVFGVDELMPVPPAARSAGDFPGEDIYPKIIAAQYQLRDGGGTCAAMALRLAHACCLQRIPGSTAA